MYGSSKRSVLHGLDNTESSEPGVRRSGSSLPLWHTPPFGEQDRVITSECRSSTVFSVCRATCTSGCSMFGGGGGGGGAYVSVSPPHASASSGAAKSKLSFFISPSSRP